MKDESKYELKCELMYELKYVLMDNCIRTINRGTIRAYFARQMSFLRDYTRPANRYYALPTHFNLPATVSFEINITQLTNTR